MRNCRVVLYLLICLLLLAGSTPALASSALPANSTPPRIPVKLVFVHLSSGGYWLADPNKAQPYGGLGRALMESNYFVSATNYGWGSAEIGDQTDIPDWPKWFLAPNREIVLDELYSESRQNLAGFGDWSRLGRDPGGENQIVLIKPHPSNSNLDGNPDDPPLDVPDDREMSVANAKAVYIALLDYFRLRPDKLFVIITAPPLVLGDTTPERAANARAFNTWLVEDWLRDYPYANVAVFDYYNVLTGTGNHHRWTGSEIEHVRSTSGNFAAYPGGVRDNTPVEASYPSTEGHSKATSEFVPLLNVYYNRWQADKDAALAAAREGAARDVVLPEAGVGEFDSELGWEAEVEAGARVECTPISDAPGGSRSLRLAYAVPEEGRGGCWHPFAVPQDWSAHRGLSFRLRGDRPGQSVRLTVLAGTPEASTPYEVRFQVTEDWELIAFVWADFALAAPAGEEGAPSEGAPSLGAPSLDPSRIMRVGFSPEAGEGTLDIADLTLFDGVVLSASAEFAAQVPDTEPEEVLPEEDSTPALEPTPTAGVRDVVPETGLWVRYLSALVPLALVALILVLLWLRRDAGPRKSPPRQENQE